jgi:hypothetical protein
MTEGTKSYLDIEPKLQDLLCMANIVATLMEEFAKDSLKESPEGYVTIMLTDEMHEAFAFAVYQIGRVARDLKDNYYSIRKGPNT